MHLSNVCLARSDMQATHSVQRHGASSAQMRRPRIQRSATPCQATHIQAANNLVQDSATPGQTCRLHADSAAAWRAGDLRVAHGQGEHRAARLHPARPRGGHPQRRPRCALRAQPGTSVRPSARSSQQELSWLRFVFTSRRVTV